MRQEIVRRVTFDSYPSDIIVGFLHSRIYARSEWEGGIEVSDISPAGGLVSIRMRP